MAAPCSITTECVGAGFNRRERGAGMAHSPRDSAREFSRRHSGTVPHMEKRNVVTLAVTIVGLVYVAVFGWVVSLDDLGPRGPRILILWIGGPLLGLGALERWLHRRL